MADDESKKTENVPEPPSEASKTVESSSVDAELEELLDSALDDFDKPPPPAAPTWVTDAGGSSEAHGGTGDAAAGEDTQDAGADPGQEALFEELFRAASIGEEGSRQFQDAMSLLMGQEPELAQQIQRLAQAAGEADETEESEQHFTDTLQQTLGSLSQNASELQQTDMSEEELLRAMSGLGLEEGGVGGAGDQDLGFMPIMQHMMKSLLSKEVLYPSLKDISSKYPDWLSENKDKISAAEHDNYRRQFELMSRICGEFEEEQEEDPPESKHQRFEKIIELMQQMQECGQPPKEIVSDMMPGMDASGLPQMPNVNNPEQCAIM